MSRFVQLLGCLLLALVAWPLSADAQAPAEDAPDEEAWPRLKLSMAVSRPEGGEPVVDACWIARQLGEAERLMKPHRVGVGLAELRELPGHDALEDAADRDALAAHVKPGVVNVFVVGSLRDVDDPTKLRMGVRWRLRRDLRKDYVIVAARAMPTTLTHELGHYLGNGHSPVVDNVMSYRRDKPEAIHFDARQGAKMRRTARRLLLTKKVKAWTDPAPASALRKRCEASRRR